MGSGMGSVPCRKGGVKSGPRRPAFDLDVTAEGLDSIAQPAQSGLRDFSRIKAMAVVGYRHP